MRPERSFIGQPIRSLQTMLRVIAEDEPTHPSVIPDGIYGTDTMNAVSFFQRKHGLPVTGVADQATWEAVVDRYRPALINVSEAQPLYLVLNPGQVIRKGERHPYLYVVQGMLKVLSQAYGSIPAPTQTGLLDEATADSIAWFQQLSALPMTGQLDKQTWKHLSLQYPLAASLIILEGFDYGL